MFDRVRVDLQRHLCCDGRASNSVVWVLFIIAFAYGFQASTVYRYGRYIDRGLKHDILYPVYLFANIFYCAGNWLMRKMYGISIDRRAVIDEGFYIGHFGGIEIGRCRIGRNCNVHQHVKIKNNCVLGDNVWVGAHAILEEGVVVEKDATIMVGARVSSPVASRCLAAGNPSRIINKNYDNKGLLGLKN